MVVPSDECVGTSLSDSRALSCAGGARQRLEYAWHRLCRAHFAQAHGKWRTMHFYLAKTFAVRLGERQCTTQFFAVRNM
jgi:hypothetical protein